MANSRNKKNSKPRVKKRFVAVDLWRSQFGPVSVKAIYDVYSQKFNVELSNMKNYSFQRCINALRKLEDPTYEEPKNQASY